MRFEWRPYVPVAQRRANARRQAAKLAKKRGVAASPIQIEGRLIARTFWGKAWCENLESYSDYENRLPRGRTYVRNGSVVDLVIDQGNVTALVAGSEGYQVDITIAQTDKRAWTKVKRQCAGSIDSLMDLLQGRFAESVMSQLTRQDGGLFPRPKDIEFECSCPDWAYMCKHVAAVLYGIGARLDDDPEMLFVLRGVDHLELTSQASDNSELGKTMMGSDGDLANEDLEAMFGIDLDDLPDSPDSPANARNNGRKRRATTTKTAGVRKKKASVSRKRATEQATQATKKKPPAKKAKKKKASTETRRVTAKTTSAKPKKKLSPRKNQPDQKVPRKGMPLWRVAANQRSPGHLTKRQGTNGLHREQMALLRNQWPLQGMNPASFRSWLRAIRVPSIGLSIALRYRQYRQRNRANASNPSAVSRMPAGSGVLDVADAP